MSNGDNLKRKSHIHRVYQDDDNTSDTWVDIERIDSLVREQSMDDPGQIEKRWKFDWDSFNPDKSDHKDIKDPDDNNNTISVPVRQKIFVNEGQTDRRKVLPPTRWQGYRHFFENGPNNTARKTHPRRVYHYDVPDDLLDGDKQPPRNPEDYINALQAGGGKKDKDQHVDVEILDSYLTNEGTKHQWQEKRWIPTDTDPLLKDPLVPGDDSPGSDAPLTPGGGNIDPPFRLDPLQNIINISWGGGLAVEFKEGAE